MHLPVFAYFCTTNSKRNMKKSNIYTRGGDKGRTSLCDGSRVEKDNIRLEAYGTIDELSAHLGLLAALDEDAENRLFIGKIQQLLFNVGACLATPSGKPYPCGCALTDGHVAMLEQAIDSLDATLPPLKAFVLNGGCQAAAQAHVCRTVCRRAERHIVTLYREAEADEVLLRFINRLSDYLFVLARAENKKTLTAEVFWQKDCD